MSLPILKKRRPIDWPLHCALDWPLTWAIAYVNDIIDAIKKLNPLLATDPRLLTASQPGRPVLQGTRLALTGTEHFEYNTGDTGDTFFGACTISAVVKMTSDPSLRVIWSKGSSSYRCYVDSSDVIVIGTTSTGITLTNGADKLIEVDFNSSADGVELRIDGVTVWTGTAPAGSSNSVPEFYVGARRSTTAGLFWLGSIADFKITGANSQRWNLNRLISNTIPSVNSGDDLTSVNNPTETLDQTVSFDPEADLGFTEGTGSNGAAIGETIPALADGSPFDTAGNSLEFPGSQYPLEPIITGTADNFTVLNSNLADDGNQPPAIFLAGIPAIWTQGDGNIPVLQVKDNGDATSSLALGLSTAPTAPEQETIDEYHA